MTELCRAVLGLADVYSSSHYDSTSQHASSYMAKADASDLFKHGLLELQGFTAHMLGVVEEFQTTGTLPELTYAGLPGPSGAHNGTSKSAVKQTAKQAKAAKAAAAEATGDPPRKPRTLSAFNWFVKAQIADMKSSGVVPTKDAEGKSINLMTMAGAKWKELGMEGQQAFSKNFKVGSCSSATLSS